jgi:hypothetical protein
MRKRSTQPGVARRREVGVGEPERHDDAAGDLVGGRVPGQLLDQQARDDVVGVRVLHRAARREPRVPFQRRVEQLIGGDGFGGHGSGEVEVLGQAALMAQQLAHRDRIGVDTPAADPARQVLLDRRVEIDLGFGGELQNRRCHKGFGDARGPDMSIRHEACAGVEVGIPRRISGQLGASTNDGHAACQLIARHDVGQRVVDPGLGAGTGARQCDEKENGTEDRDAH